MAHNHGADVLGHLIEWLGHFHPPVVAFPTALLASAVLAEALGWWTKRATFPAAARFCLAVGTVGAVVGAVLGWCFGGFDVMSDDWELATHRWVGTGAALWTPVALGLCIVSTRPGGEKWRPAYLAALGIGFVAVSVAGFFGGGMTWGLDHYAW